MAQALTVQQRIIVESVLQPYNTTMSWAQPYIDTGTLSTSPIVGTTFPSTNVLFPEPIEPVVPFPKPVVPFPEPVVPFQNQLYLFQNQLYLFQNQL